MIKVKISDYGDMPPIIRQTPSSSGIWDNIEFHVNEPIDDADYWFVMHSCARKEECRCPKENIYLLTQEPISVKPYPNAYLNQFSGVLSCQEDLVSRGAIRSFPANPWFVGAKMIARNPWRWQITHNYDSLSNRIDTERFNKIAIITSNKRLTEGHIKRLEFIKQIKLEFPDKIDIFGSGFREIEDKYDIYTKYRYALIIENSCYPDYWTEKLSDCYLSECFPLYYGCPNIDEYFPTGSFEKININDIEKSISIISKYLNQDVFLSDTKRLVSESKDLILNKYNIFALISRIINSRSNTNRFKSKIQINPLMKYELSKLDYCKYKIRSYMKK